MQCLVDDRKVECLEQAPFGPKMFRCLFLTQRKRFSVAVLSMIAMFGIKSFLQHAEAQPERPYTISKTTTYFTGPLKPDGSIDFIAALNEHFSKAVDADNNAAAIIVPLLDSNCWSDLEDRNRTLIQMGLIAEDYPPGDALNKTLSGFEESSPQHKDFLTQYDAADSTPGNPWANEDFPLVAEWFGENEGKLERIVEAAEREHFFVPLPQISESDNFWPVLIEWRGLGMRSLARTYSIRADSRLAAGQWQKSWNDILTIKRLSKHVSRGPTMIDTLVGGAIHGIACRDAVDFIAHAHGQVDWQSLLNSWETGPIAKISEGLSIGERAYIAFVVCEHLVEPNTFRLSLDYGEGGDDVPQVEARRSQLEQSFARGEIKLDDALRLSNEYFDQVASASEMLDPDERRAALEKQATLLGEDNDASAMDRVLAATPERQSQIYAEEFLALNAGPTRLTIQVEFRRRGSQNVVKLGLAARTFQNMNGRLPSSLDELSGLVEKDVMVQPQSGERMGFILKEDGLVIYHWGHNEKDDGGDIDSEQSMDWGLRIRK